MSMVDGFPYKEEVGGSNPSVPTIYESQEEFLLSSDRRSIVREGMRWTNCLPYGFFDISGLHAES